MTIVPHKVNRKGHEYYELIEEKWVNGKVEQKYIGYLGKNPNSKKEITPEDTLPYVERLLNIGISQDEIDQILRKIGIEYDAWPITKIIIENDLKLKKVFLKLK
jgi:ABC-type multidrug transport system ATPase subunit